MTSTSCPPLSPWIEDLKTETPEQKLCSNKILFDLNTLIHSRLQCSGNLEKHELVFPQK